MYNPFPVVVNAMVTSLTHSTNHHWCFFFCKVGHHPALTCLLVTVAHI
jgi:hypothetical protein